MNVLITGGANGIGKKTAVKLIERGHDVKVFDRDAEALDRLDRDIETFEGDVRDKEDLEEATRRFEVDVLINSAGFQQQGAVEDLELDSFQEHIETNYLGTVKAVKTVMDSLRRNEGRVINISSIAGLTGAPFLSAYSASKHAVEGFSDSLRMELNDSGVDVVVVEPGPIKTGFNLEAQENLMDFIPGSRYAKRYQKILNKDINGAKTNEAASKIVKAVEADNPKSRYTVTRVAYLTKKLKSFVPDKFWDKMVLSRY